ncbi:MAG: hypothetical protein LZF60_310121 [Nitrospira sp.]|nr:MAG: hypothetical protein LZF60_310121 [Nitrospira sp.]
MRIESFKTVGTEQTAINPADLALSGQEDAYRSTAH